MAELQSTPAIATDPSATVASSNEIYDVIIVGAGPIGLATAIGLYQRGIENILVFDQTRAFRPVGQVIDLLPNGLKALKYLDRNAYEQVKQAGLKFSNSARPQSEKTTKTSSEKTTKSSSEWVIKNLQGQRIRAIPLGYDDWVQDYGEGRFSIPWYELQTTLRNLLPPDRVQANHRCIQVVNEPDLACVRVDFVSSNGLEFNPYQHWEDAQNSDNLQPENSQTMPQQSAIKSLRAKLVVAADGINSTVRKVLYQDQPYQALARPEYSGFGAIGCREITEIPTLLWQELAETFFQDSRIVTLTSNSMSDQSDNLESPRIILFRRPDGQSIGYIIHLPLPLDALQSKSESELIELALAELKTANFPDSIQQLVQLSVFDKMIKRPYYIHRATLSDSLPFPHTASLNAANLLTEMQPNWYADRVVLVGDAAHGMPPFMAQGANQGLEDAMVVVTLIADLAEQNLWDDLCAIAQAFEKYQSLRRPFMVGIQQATLRQISFVYNQDMQEYNQQVYCRDFEKILTGLLA